MNELIKEALEKGIRFKWGDNFHIGREDDATIVTLTEHGVSVRSRVHDREVDSPEVAEVIGMMVASRGHQRFDEFVKEKLIKGPKLREWAIERFS